MTQVIDMGGFKNQTIEVRFGDDKYDIQLDPPIEVYRQVMEVQNKKLETEDDWQSIKEIVATLICINNKDLNKDEFIQSLTKAAALKFFNSYVNILYKSSDLKNSSSPLEE